MKRIDLSGEYTFTFDWGSNGEDRGFQHGNWKEEHPVKLPGTLNTNGLGKPLDEEAFTLRNHLSMEMPRPNHSYVYNSWFKKSIFFSKENIQDQEVYLFFERVIFKSKLWINGEFVGENSSLSTPHKLNITKFIKPEQDNLFVITVDNRDVYKIGKSPHAYTEQTQTLWNGIVGKMELHFCNKVEVDDIQIFTSLKDIDVKVKVNSALDVEKAVNIDLKILDGTTSVYSASKTIPITSNHEESFPIDLWTDAKLWDEFTPNLHKLEVKLSYDNIEEIYERNFGIRDVTTEGRHILINGNRVSLRGNLDCCIFPLTGYPETSLEYWVENMNLLKSYGLNHVRFHSWCPPEAAFAAADMVGVYVQAEGPLWLDYWMGRHVGDSIEHYDFFPREHEAISKCYGNHPSFIIFSNGNELSGDFSLLEKMIRDLRQQDPRRLYTLTSNWDRKRTAEDDVFIASHIDGMCARAQESMDVLCASTALQYDKVLERCEVPFIAHEIGQYAVYPDIRDIEKYTGPINPVNYKAVKKDLESKNLLKYVEEFVNASGRLSKILYKAEIESMLNTEKMAGFQLLGLNDFSGQNTATIGMLNAFWESKGLTTPEEFSSFCGEIVPLFMTDKIVYNSAEEMYGLINIYNYSNKEYNDATVTFKILVDNEVFKETEFKHVNLKKSCLNKVSQISYALSGISEATKAKVEVSIKGTDIKNTWDIWVYSAVTNFERANNFEILHTLSEKDLKELEAGKNILLIPDITTVKDYKNGNFTTVFWSPIMFLSEKSCGIMCDDKHKVFHNFITDKYSDFQWKNILVNSISMSIDALGENFEPIVQVVPNFFFNQKLANMFEAKVGNGKLFVCTIDIFNYIHNDLPKQYLKESIFKYLNSVDFSPKQTLTVEDLHKIFKS